MAPHPALIGSLTGTEAGSTALVAAAALFFCWSLGRLLQRELGEERPAGAPAAPALPDVHDLPGPAAREVEYLERLLAAQPAPAPIAFRLGQVVVSTVSARRATGLTADVLSGDEVVTGLPGDVAVVLDNLLVNAHRHGRGQGVRVESARTGEYVEIVVSDRGPGVPDYLRPVLFEPGVRAEPGTNGMGLHMSRNLLRDQGGDLVLRDTDEGAAFVVRVPAQRRASRRH